MKKTKKRIPVDQMTMKKSTRKRRTISAAQGVENVAKVASNKPKRVEDLRIVDILTMPLYAENVAKVIKQIKRMIDEWHAGKRPLNPRYVHAYEKFEKAGTLKKVGDVIALYAEILDKKASGYSAIEREVIKGICVDAFNMTMPILIEDEKKRDNSDGDN